MNVTVNEVDQHKVTLHIEIPVKDASKMAVTACKNLAGKVNIPGFRKGKAPRMVLESFLGKDAVKQEIEEAIMNKAYPEALKEQKIDPVTDPEIQVVTADKGKDFVFEATLTKKPEVTLGEYKGIQVGKDIVNITDEDIDKEVKNLQKQHAKLLVAPEGTAIENEDFAIIDFQGSIDGKPFAGGEGKAYPLEIGSHSFIPGFEEQLIGLKAGEEKDVKVTFPEDYHEAGLAGKEAVFAVKINDVKRRELPEINDEFAKEVGKFENVEELRNDVKKRIFTKVSLQAVETFNNEVLKTVMANATVDIPQVMVDDKVNQMVDEMAMKLQAQGMNLDAYLKYTKMDVAKLKEQYAAPAKENVKMDLVLEAVAKAEDIQVTEQDVNAEIYTMAQNFGADPKEVYKIILKEHRVPLLIQSVGRKKAASFILSKAIDTNEKKEEVKPEA